MSISRLGAELEIRVDVQGIPADVLEQVDAVPRGNDMGDAAREVMDRRSRRVFVPQSMNMPVYAEQQVRSHVAVQEQQRMGG